MIQTFGFHKAKGFPVTLGRSQHGLTDIPLAGNPYADSHDETINPLKKVIPSSDAYWTFVEGVVGALKIALGCAAFSFIKYYKNSKHFSQKPNWIDWVHLGFVATATPIIIIMVLMWPFEDQSDFWRIAGQPLPNLITLWMCAFTAMLFSSRNTPP